MKNRLRLIVSLAALAPLTALAAASEALLYVQVRNTKLRAEPKFWSAQKADLDYGSAVTPLGAAPNDKSWLKVKKGDTEGFVHVSAITKRRIVLSGQAVPNGKGVDQSSIVLAGKGFNSQVEDKYRAANGLDYAAVDEVTKLGVDGAEEAAFIAEGKLNS